MFITGKSGFGKVIGVEVVKACEARHSASCLLHFVAIGMQHSLDQRSEVLKMFPHSSVNEFLNVIWWRAAGHRY